MASAWRLAGLLWLGMTAAGGAALAQDGAAKLPLDARISANAPADWQPAAGLEARPGEAGLFHQKMAEEFRAAIAARGWPEGRDTPAVLSFRYGVQATADPNQAPVQLRGSKGSSGGDEEAEVLLQLKLKRNGDEAFSTSERVMTVTVSDRQNHVLWQAAVKASVGKAGDAALAEALIPKVLDYLGKDAFEEPLR